MTADPGLRALNRFGLGARAGEHGRFKVKPWLQSQVQPTAVHLARQDLPNTATIVEELAEFRRSGGGQDARKSFRQQGRTLLVREIKAALNQAVATDFPFAERLARFWSNHFAISTQGEQLVTYLAGAYEREAIRPHVFGRFEDMVLATARHPAMLIYLDQARSFGPNARATRNNNRGLNENYARELLELHTVGVKGGYSQQDVTQLALILTGWTVGGLYQARNQSSTAPFRFEARMHEPGTKQFLGRTWLDAGEKEGREAIALLCRQPATATFIATKLVRHFVEDDPNPNDVSYIAQVFQQSGGDLKAVSLALINLDRAFLGPQRKIRTPQEFLIASARALGLRSVDENAARVLQQMRHVPWAPLSPAGYSDETYDWADPDSLLRRADLAQRIAKMARQAAVLQPEKLMESRAPALLSKLLDQQPNAVAKNALILASPTFQWR